MKLRVRSSETKDTIRLEISNSASIRDLKALIASTLPSADSAAISPDDIRLSLNRSDELLPASNDPAGDTLSALGLASGDLVFYALRSQHPLSGGTIPEVTTAKQSEIDDVKGAAISSELISEPSNEIKSVTGPEAEMDVEEEEAAVVEYPLPSVPGFLKRILEAEMPTANGVVEILVIAVHAVLLESGFSICDGDGIRLPQGWASSAANMSLKYSIPDLLGESDAKMDAKIAKVKFSIMKNYVFVYGFVGDAKPSVYHVNLDAEKVVPLLISLADVKLIGEGEKKDVFEFWRIVKDKLALPLLIDVCEKNGLPLPPCFGRVPTDIKLKIFELLPCEDLLRIGCTCKELSYLSSNEDLWKKKFEEEFGSGAREAKKINGRGSWKAYYMKYLKEKRDRERKRSRDNFLNPMFVGPRVHFRDPFGPQRFPVIGGDYDLYPSVGPFGTVGGLARVTPANRRNFSPQCDFRRSHFG